jgi:hypothetical protein
MLAEDLAADPRGEHSADTQSTYVSDTARIIRESPDHIRASISE